MIVRMVPQAADPMEMATMRGVSADFGPWGVHSPTSALAFWAAQSFRSSGSTWRVNDADDGREGDGDGKDDENDENDDDDAQSSRSSGMT